MSMICKKPYFLQVFLHNVKILLLSVLAVTMIGVMVPSAFGQTYPTLVLDEIPSAVYAGQSITFTGKLSFQNQPILLFLLSTNSRL